MGLGTVPSQVLEPIGLGTVPSQILEPDPEVLEPLLVLREELVRLLADRVEGEHQALHLKQHSLHSNNYFLLNVRCYRG